MDPLLCVQIYAVCESDNEEDDGLFIGTGYPIRSNLILTARHVVIKSADVAVTKRYMVWPKYDKHTIDFDKADIIYQGSATYDVAVIRLPDGCERLPFDVPSTQFFHGELSTGTCYETRGFLHAMKEGNIRKALNVTGDTTRPIDHTIQLNTDIDTEEKSGWGGLSGAAVFVDGDKIAGVMVSVFGGMTHAATAHSILPLLQDEKIQLLLTPSKTINLSKQIPLISQLLNEVELTEVSTALKEYMLNDLDIDCYESSNTLAQHLAEKMSAHGIDLLDVFIESLDEVLEAQTDVSESSPVCLLSKELFSRLLLFYVPESALQRYLLQAQPYYDIPTKYSFCLTLYLALLYDFLPEFSLEAGHEIIDPDVITLSTEAGFDFNYKGSLEALRADNKQLDVASKMIFKTVYKRLTGANYEGDHNQQDQQYLNKRLQRYRNKKGKNQHSYSLAALAHETDNPLHIDTVAMQVNDVLPDLPISRQCSASDTLKTLPNEGLLKAQIVSFLELIDENTD